MTLWLLSKNSLNVPLNLFAMRLKMMIGDITTCEEICQIMSCLALFVGIPLYSLFSLVFLLKILQSELQIPWINPGFPLCFVAEATEPMATFLGQTPYQSPYQTKSFVWKYCTKLGKDEAVCDICGRHYNIGRGSTSQLRKHLKSWHQIVDESVMN